MHVIEACIFLIAPSRLYLPVYSNISITSPYLVPQNNEESWESIARHTTFRFI